MSNKTQPVIKWVGGKRQLLPIIKENLPKEFGSYYEPFVGGGAVFCELSPQTATINDCNRQLVNMYKWVKRAPSKLCKALSVLQTEYNQLHTMEQKDKLYYKLREEFNVGIQAKEDTLRMAALFIFLNKMGYNGLYRINRKGTYNVATSHKKTADVFNQELVMQLSKQLKGVQILCGDFAQSCKKVRKGDFIFFDSPYYDTFDIYQADGFSEEDHLRLFNLFRWADSIGAFCMLTNSDSDYIKNLYKDYKVKVVDVKRLVNRDATKRVGKEVIITNY